MEHAFLVHHDGDHVGVAVTDIPEGSEAVGLVMGTGRRVAVRAAAPIPLGHKVALRDLEEGALVLKYGSPIGRATARIRAGDHVHTHNLRSVRW